MMMMTTTHKWTSVCRLFFSDFYVLIVFLGRIAVLRMSKVWRIVTDRAAWSVCWSVTVVSRAKMAEPIELQFGLRTWLGPRNHVLDERPHPP